MKSGKNDAWDDAFAIKCISVWDSGPWEWEREREREREIAARACYPSRTSKVGRKSLANNN